MITRESPEGRFLVVVWRAMIGMSGTVSEQYRWLLTGIAGVLSVLIANLKSLREVMYDASLKWSLCLLVGSVLFAAAAYLLSAATKAQAEIAAKLDAAVDSPAIKAALDQATLDPVKFREELCRPFFGPLGWIMRRAAEKGARDPFAQEKGSIRLIVLQAYAMWVGIFFAALSLLILVCGIRQSADAPPSSNTNQRDLFVFHSHVTRDEKPPRAFQSAMIVSARGLSAVPR